VIKHPGRVVEAPSSAILQATEHFGRFFFAPTPCRDPEIVRRAARWVGERGMRLLTRAPEGREEVYRSLAENIEILDGPIEYDATVLAARGIAVLNRYEYRVSGVFFEALSAEKECLMRNCLFAREAGETYPDAKIELLPE
jgi:hypothetical protein